MDTPALTTSLLTSLLNIGILPERISVRPDGAIDLVLPPLTGLVVPLPAPEPAELAETPSALALLILGVLRGADRPLKGEALAGRCARTCSGPFRKVLAQLRKDGQIELGEAGYLLVPILPEATP